MTSSAADPHARSLPAAAAPVAAPAMVPAPDLPARLLRQFALIAAVAALAIVALATFGIRHVFDAEQRRTAEETSRRLSELVAKSERRTLQASATAPATLAIAAADLPGFDRRMRDLLGVFRMYKIKIFAPDRRIIYSTDPAIIGRSEVDNAELAATLRTGAVSSHLEEAVDAAQRSPERPQTKIETYAPLVIDGRIVGAFETYTDVSASRQNVNAAMVRILAILVTLLGIGIIGLMLPMRRGMRALQGLSTELHRRATTDSLTGLLNRQTILEALEHERVRHDRTTSRCGDRGLAIAALDIDHFKRINDTHGHQAGDAVLREFAARLLGSLRPYDIAGRNGGEEFLVILPTTSLDEGLAAAERLRKGIADTPFAAGGIDLAVTVSIGVAWLGDTDETTDSLISRADAALYRAKREGRNRTCAADLLG